ncbi:hypothetical protein COZ61_01190 [Candidatus Berkelbacteria bacterium CG_4_8_14_3_um_filter_33_6]|uniref:Peptidase M23 domain-containing protein n=1 Tax=Candidatus Berkelbacteria bacterium CG_4_10_14_0_2_um_filter_35_9_33_12 TaxID=1974499 RepID=A0A2M7W3Z0_9BACT|nr:MAG: hypothetical protein COX10_01530 [Candidatus Berkelbacteria bacterium CG23_combo_of_CG06-09_8_20_14_all_33_15]PIX31171.1 MAG: hypothetical protein COZ61_01190 [Candidatus Berkelbacteria bacterium CG_4_8_14_3_um_filter_33_6]PIZ28256.1 MAG: hypothetical protein COY43_01480 [Candidatus Berkelbacteria bacterium CG_4_10_14_0_8_um_filter_35_9_33_8]PJA20336.1 MAG: hypothetical protein COX60_01915 [Candidatus Berkelbacteria bacterium CG_4_10_14_0_2_um_filter_35_9_33_12]PJB52044.1 MAG: hypotheti
MNKKIIIISVFGLVVIFGFLVVISNLKNKTAPQPVLTANFIDLDKVDKISKYRSCQGHTVVPQESMESKRNMKHYVVLKPEFTGGNKVPVYSPLNGVVKSIRSEPDKGLEGEIWLGVKGNDWDFSIQHINIASNIKGRQKVKAGDIIGYVANRGIDVVYGVGARSVKMIDGRYESPYSDLDSPFNHMGTELIAQYQAKGINQNDMSYTKEQRDAISCQYRENDNEGGLNDFAHPEDWVEVN